MKKNYNRKTHLKMLLVAAFLILLGTAAQAQAQTQSWDKWCYKDFTTQGTYNYTIPPGCTKVIIEAIGGGGAGGACSGSSLQYGVNLGTAGGGGGGAYARTSAINVESRRTLNVTVGAGGISQFEQEPRDGGSSIVKLDNTVLIQAPGGQSVGTNLIPVDDGDAWGGLGGGTYGTAWASEPYIGYYITDVNYGGCSSGKYGSSMAGYLRISSSGGGAGGGCGTGSCGTNPEYTWHYDFDSHRIRYYYVAQGGAGGEGGCTGGSPDPYTIKWLAGGNGGAGRGPNEGYGNGRAGQAPGGGGGGARAAGYEWEWEEFGYDYQNFDGGPGADGMVRIWFYIPEQPNEMVTASSSATGICCYGQEITFNATPSNTLGSLSYQWSDNMSAQNPYKNVTATHTYTVTMTDNLRNYSTGSCLAQRMAYTTVQVYPAINPGRISAQNQVFSKGDPAPTINNITLASGGNGNLQYQWYYRYNNSAETIIPGATGTSYTPTSDMMNTNGTYSFIRKAKDNTDCCQWHPAASVYNMTIGENIVASGEWNNWCYKDYTGNGTFIKPAFCDSVLFEAIGGGGAGGAQELLHSVAPPFPYYSATGGGGGGAYARSKKLAAADQAYTITIGLGGVSSEIASNTPTNGGTTKVSLGQNLLLSAVGGKTATRYINDNWPDAQEALNNGSTHPGGTGGSKDDCAGDAKDIAYSGGNGSVGVHNTEGFGVSEFKCILGGAGGGAGGGSADGSGGSDPCAHNNQTAPTGGTGGNGGASTLRSDVNWLTGGRGANGTDNSDGWESHHDGNNYGGGGSGTRVTRWYEDNSHQGGSGAQGMVRVWYHISAPVSVTVTPKTAHICPGASTTFSASATGPGTLSYYWNGGTNNRNISISSAGSYSLSVESKISDNCVKTFTGEINVTAYPQLNAGAISSGENTICSGSYCSEITETTAATGAGVLSYRWKVNGTVIPEAESTTYTPGAAYTEVPGTYNFTREVMGSECDQPWTASSGTFKLIVTPKPQANDDSYARNLNYTGAITCKVLDNDLYASVCATPDVVLAVQPEHGIATWDATNRVFTYRANDGYEGDDQFQYTLYCSQVECGTTATVSISATSLDLSCATAVGSNSYRFEDAHTTGIVRSISAGFIEDPENCSVELPTLPAGWTASGSEYYKFLNVPANVSNDVIDNVIQNIVFIVPENTLKEVVVMADATEQPADVFYCSSTQHYYQYIKFNEGEGNLTWMDCYDKAMNRTYLGRKGYLATFTSLEEDKFITRVAGAPAWVGATRLPNSSPIGAQYYDPAQFETSHQNSPLQGDKWYWACGPERDQILFDRIKYSGSGNDIYYNQSNQAGDYIYSNWGPGEPNSSSNDESCLTVLKLGDSYTGYQNHTTCFSWNDKSYSSNYIHDLDMWSPQGYMVEYGDMAVGNSTPDVLETQVRDYRKIGNVKDTIRARLTVVRDNRTLCSVTDSAYLKVELEGKAPFSFTLKATADSVARTYTNVNKNVIYVPTTPNPISKYWLEDLSDATSLDPCGHELVIFNPDTVVTIRDLRAPSFTGFLSDATATGEGCTFVIPDMTDAMRAIVTDDATPIEDLLITQNPAAGTPFTESTEITVYVTDACGRMDSTTTMVYMPAAPTVSVTGDKYACFNGSNKLVATPTGVAPFTFAWNNSMSGDTNIVSSFNKAGKDTARVTVTDANGCTATGSFVFTVYNDFVAGQISASGLTICLNGTATNIGSVQSARGGDNNISYQWYVNDALIEGATAETFTPGAEYTTVPGSYSFTRKAKDGRCLTEYALSDGVYTLVVEGLTSAGAISTNGETICQNGDAATIVSDNDAAGQGTITYQWYADGLPISNATAATYTPGAAYTSTPGTYIFTRKAKLNSCSVEQSSTGSYTLVVKANPTILASGNANCVSDNEDGTVEVTVAQGLAPYQLACDTLTHELAAAGSYTFTGLADGSYQVSVTDANGCSASTENAISVLPNSTTIKVVSNSNQWTYDGSEHSDLGYSVQLGDASFTGTSDDDLNLGDGLVLNVHLFKTITNVGLASNDIASYTLKKNSEDVTCTYQINTTSGTLEITRAASSTITLTCPSAEDLTKEYDGTGLQPVASAEGLGSDIIVVEYSLNGTDGWTTTVPKLTHAGSQKVYVRASNLNYTTATCDYTLVVTPRHIEMTSASASQCLSVAASLKKEMVTITEGSFVAGEGVTYRDFSSVDGLSVTSIDNEFQYDFNEGTLAADYQVTTVFGTLKVQQCSEDQIVLTLPDAEDLIAKYDGQPHGPAATADADSPNPVIIQYSLDGGNTWSDDAPTLTHAGDTSVTVKASCLGFDDVTDNYTLVVIPRDITLKSLDSSRAYNGVALSYDAVQVSGDGFVSGEGMNYADFASITNVGSIQNSFEATCKPGTLSSDYNISYSFGQLTVTPGTDLEITSTTEDLSKEKIYDGEKLWSEPSSNISEGTYYQYQVGTGEWTDTIPYITHVNEGPIDVSVRAVNPNYDTSAAVNFTLTLNQRNLILTSGTASKEYDGTPLKKEEVTPSGDGFAFGESATYSNFASITNAGTVDNQFAYELAANTLASDYDVNTLYGTLTVIGCSNCMTLTLPSDTTFTYDGDEHTPSDVVVGGTAADDPDTEVEYSTDGGNTWTDEKPSITHVADGPDTVYVRVTNPSADTLVDSFILSVEPREVVLTSGTLTKTYDGFALVGSGSLDVTGEGFISGEGIDEVNYTGAQLSVGVSNNTFDYSLKSNTQATDYTITRQYGTLTVTKCSDCITVTPPDVLEKIYDGEPLEGEVIAETNVPDDYLKEEYSIDGGETWSPEIPSITDADTIQVIARVTNPNCDTVIITYPLKVTPVEDLVEVHIKGHHQIFVWDGSEHTVSGYDLTSENALYQANIMSRVRFVGDSSISLTAVDTAYMNLNVADFSNLSPSFTNVNFVLDADGYIAVRVLGPAFVAVEDKYAYTDLDKSYYSYTGTGDNWEPTVNSLNGLASLTYTVSGATQVVTGGNQHLAGQKFEAGLTEVRWTAVDTLGHVTYYTQKVTIIDNQKPKVTPIANQERLPDWESTDYTCYGSMWDPNATDNVGVTSMTCTLSGATTGTYTTLDGVTFEHGVTTVVWTASDAAGNDSTITFTVTVGDFTAPCIGCVPFNPYDTSGVSCSTIGTNGVVSLTASVDNNYTVTDNSMDVTAADNDYVAKLFFTLEGTTTVITDTNITLNGQVFELGSTTVTWHAIDPAGNESTCSLSVSVGDHTPPCIGCTPEYPDDPTAGVDCSTIVANASVHGGDTVYVGTNTGAITYTHSGTSWNVTAGDDLSVPTLTYSVAGATSTVTVSNTSLNGQVFPMGNTTVTWTAVDASNNSSTCSFVVSVKDNEPPYMSSPDDITEGITCSDLVPDPYSSLAAFRAAGGVASDNDSIVATSFRYADESDGNSCPETISRTYYVKDLSGNESSCTQHIVVNDNVKPTFTAPRDTALCRTSTGEEYFPITVTGDVTDESDNCTSVGDLNATFTDELASGSDATDKVYNRIWSLIDNCGNETTHIQKITIHPSILTPGNYSLTCHDINEVLNYGDCEMFVNIGTPTVINNITGMEITLINNAPADNIYPEGTTIVTWTATDECGASVSCDQTITVTFPECPVAVDADGNEYESVRIGCDCWTKRNLESLTYSDDADIPGVYNYVSDVYPNENDNVAIFGRLYDWASVIRDGATNEYGHVQGICPDGWYLPTAEKFAELSTYGVDALKSPNYWLDGGGSNTTGFTSLPGGYYDGSIDRYMNLMGEAYYWSASKVDDEWTPVPCNIRYICNQMIGATFMEGLGYSVRCIKEIGTVPAEPTFTCGTSTVSDVDGNSYNTVKIGKQCWTKENLKTSKKPNGDAITEGVYAPNDNDSNIETYGRLYTWATMMNGASSSEAKPSNVQGICPEGWHVPSDAEWTALTDYVAGKSNYQCDGNSDNIAKALASKQFGNESNVECAVGNNLEANDATGFSALAAGYYGDLDNFFNRSANFWTTTNDPEDDGKAYYRYIYNIEPGVTATTYRKECALSVRCVKN